MSDVPPPPGGSPGPDFQPPPQPPQPPPMSPGAGVPPAGAPTRGGRGPLGEPRSIGKTILLAIVTLGIWAAMWTYWNYKELKLYRGDGIGGGLGVVLHIFVAPVTYFLMANEVEKLHSEEGQEPPVRTITGLWILLPLAGPFVWYVKVQTALNDFWMARGAPAPS